MSKQVSARSWTDGSEDTHNCCFCREAGFDSKNLDGGSSSSATLDLTCPLTSGCTRYSQSAYT